MDKTLFEHRHFVWLAAYAAQYMSKAEAELLANKLADTNPRFDHSRFMRAATGNPFGRDAARCN